VNKCQWRQSKDRDEDGIYSTSCGGMFYFDNGSLSDNEFKFCPYCGREIEEVEGK